MKVERNIDLLPSGKYRVRVVFAGRHVTQTFATIEAARARFRLEGEVLSFVRDLRRLS